MPENTPILQMKKQLDITEHFRKILDIQTPSSEQEVKKLSAMGIFRRKEMTV